MRTERTGGQQTGGTEPSVSPPLFPWRPRCARLERFDDAHLDLVAGQVDAVALVLESHILSLLAWLRPQEDAEAILGDLEHAVELCAVREIPLEVEVPFMTENASSLPESVASFAAAGVSTIRVVPAREVPGRERPLDPFACFSEPYVGRIRLLCEEAAEAEGAQLVWEPREGATFDLRELPGSCEDAWGRVTVRRDGRVTPCIYARAGELDLGTLEADGLREIWQGRETQDLRRAHATWDYPGACSACPRVSAAGAQRPAPFMSQFAAEVIGWTFPEPGLEIVSPAPLARSTCPPTITLLHPQADVRAWHLAWSRGGTAGGLEKFPLSPEAAGGPAVSLTVPSHAWDGMEANVGYWWAVFAEFEDGAWAMTPGARCLVSHERVPRLAGSLLRYPGDGRRDGSRPVFSASVDEDEYNDLVARVREVSREVIPTGAIAAVVSRGDERLCDLDAVEGWHFPRADDGTYAGFHPLDGDWAVEHLRALQAAGARYLVVPVTASWWYEAYPELAAYVRESCALVIEERGTCVVVALPEGTS
jgi:radical SAM protein with 4Fe4S-binding SPASM domain